MHTFTQSICNHYFCFENQGWFVTLKKNRAPCFLKKAGCKKPGPLLLKKRRGTLVSSLFDNNAPVFFTLLFAIHILDPFFLSWFWIFSSVLLKSCPIRDDKIVMRNNMGNVCVYLCKKLGPLIYLHNYKYMYFLKFVCKRKMPQEFSIQIPA